MLKSKQLHISIHSLEVDYTFYEIDSVSNELSGSWLKNFKRLSAGPALYCRLIVDPCIHINGYYCTSDCANIDCLLCYVGAYCPRYYMGPVHVDPKEALLMHHDLRSRMSVGIHWGTFPMGSLEVRFTQIFMVLQ